ncbi:TetR/AcrR family transcriptional regulator [Amycolatopsis magusensis]|uniref:TetR/AcrR family transcriptional regulator n=1 Tax=Amycolatopsis magusensis TaxID=882444 RepID=UPI003C2DF9FA
MGGRPRNRRGEGGKLRAEILSAATELLDACGDPRAVTLRAVARQAGITAPSIYAHFRDQPAVLLDVVREAFAELSGWLRSAVDDADDDPRRRLYLVCRAYLDFAHEHPERYRAMFSGTGPANVPAVLADCLARCVAAGHCTSTDPAADAVALWLGLHGFAHQRAVSGAFRWPDDIVQRIASSLSRLV